NDNKAMNEIFTPQIGESFVKLFKQQDSTYSKNALQILMNVQDELLVYLVEKSNDSIDLLFQLIETFVKFSTIEQRFQDVLTPVAIVLMRIANLSKNSLKIFQDWLLYNRWPQNKTILIKKNEKEIGRAHV